MKIHSGHERANDLVAKIRDIVCKLYAHSNIVLLISLLLLYF